MRSRLKKLVLICLVFSLSGCVTATREWIDARLGRTPPPVKTVSVTVEETWCYRTLGAIECYKGPQRLPPESLVSVNPPGRLPKSRDAYAAALAAYEEAGKAK